MEQVKTTIYCSQFFIVLLMAIVTHNVRADALGVYAGIGSWNHTAEGKMNHLGTDADMENNFGFEDDFSGFAYIAFEHFIPIVPNIRVSRYSLETTGTKTVTASNEFTFAGTAYTNGTAIASELRWDEEDALLYYEFLDNIVSFDLG